MANGNRVIINTRERLVSDDHNQEWAFLLAQLAELGGVGLADSPDGAMPAAKNHLLNSLVVNGLLVRPDAGTHVTVDAGTALFYDPAFATADEGPVILAKSAGETSPTAMPFVANGLGQIRCDVIECRPVDVLVTSSSRDIYDPVTRTFSPAVVQKVRRVQLEFRLRNGAPGIVESTDWLPLAVAFVKPADASYATVDFYDVRPLAAERVGSSSRLDGRAVTDLEVDCTLGAVEGTFAGTAYGYAAGCRDASDITSRNAPISSVAYFNDTTDPTGGMLTRVEWTPDNAANGLVPVNGQLLGLYAVFPALSATPLPRWRRYSQSAAPREPSGPRGILVLDASGRGNASYLANNVVLPASIVGCLAANPDGIVAGFGWYNLSTVALHVARGGRGQIAVPAIAAATIAANTLTSPPTTITWNAIAGNWYGYVYPAYCKGIGVELKIVRDLDGSGPRSCFATFDVSVVESDGSVPLVTHVAHVLSMVAQMVPTYSRGFIALNSGPDNPVVTAIIDNTYLAFWTTSAVPANHTLRALSFRYW